MTIRSDTRHGRYVGPPGDTREYWLPRDLAIWESAWAKATGQVVVDLDDDLPERQRRGEADMSPEAVAARALAKAREAEAMAYVKSYTGTWGLPLDIRADRRWGTAHHHLTERQVEVLLAGRDRDLERAKAREAERDPRYPEAVAWLAVHARNEFQVSLLQQAERFHNLTPKQLDAVDRMRGVGPSGSPQEAPHATIAEPGMYQDPDGNIFKVQLAIHGSGRPYAKRLVVDEDTKTGTFEYWPGGIRSIKPEWRMTPEQAAEFGHLYGLCCVCGRTLTDERSIAAGIGPICGGRI